MLRPLPTPVAVPLAFALLLLASLAGGCAPERSLLLGLAIAADGSPISGAQVRSDDGERIVLTGTDGRFVMDLGGRKPRALRVDGAAAVDGPFGVQFLPLASLRWRRNEGNHPDGELLHGEAEARRALAVLAPVHPALRVALDPAAGLTLSAATDGRYRLRVPAAEAGEAVSLGIDPVPLIAAAVPKAGLAPAAAAWVHPAEITFAESTLQLPNPRGLPAGSPLGLWRRDPASPVGALLRAGEAVVSESGDRIEATGIRAGGYYVVVAR